MNHLRLCSSLLSVALVTGCDQPNPAAHDVSSRGHASNGIQFNGIQFNNVSLQGPLLQGPLLQGPLLQGIQLNGSGFLAGPAVQSTQLQGVTLNTPYYQGPLLAAPSLDGTAFTGVLLANGSPATVGVRDFVGSEWELRMTQVEDDVELSAEVVLRIDSISTQDDLHRYDIVYRERGGSVWHPLCVDGQGDPVAAIPLQNYWNLSTGDRIDTPDVFTFACTSAALGKCVLWGYHPWDTAVRCDNTMSSSCHEVSLADYHQACTRMARADYCGDGTSWTVNGTTIDIYDRLAPPIQAEATDWPVEAEWTPAGAGCVDALRQQAWQAEGLYPECFLDEQGDPVTLNDCGSMIGHRALLTSKYDGE